MRKLFTYLTFLLLVSLLLPSCQREWEDGRDTETTQETEEREGSWIKIHYQATASGGADTKATLDALDRHYLFERDDLLYVVDKSTGGNKLYGFMYLTAGAGATTAVFEGDLMYFVEKSAGVYEPERPANDLAITATLVSKTQQDNNIYTFVTNNAGKIAPGCPVFGYGETHDGYAETFKEAVQKYGVFKADATFGRPSFALAQQTAFLLFNLSFEDEITDSTPITVSVTNDNGAGTVLFSHEVTPTTFHQASFVVAFKGDGTVSLSNAQLRVTDTGGGALIDRTKKLTDATLQGNRYYNVVKPFLNLDYFTIQAGEDDTDIVFAEKCKESDFALQYKEVGGVWTNVSDDSSVHLTAGSRIIVRGKGTRYRYSYLNSTLFTSTYPCYIYGDIMSLFCDGSYNKKTSFGSFEEALKQTFKNMVNMDIHPARPLFLSATTLSNSCYEEMFAGSSITRAPEFANDAGEFAAIIPKQACMNMFKGCTSLTAAPELPANGSIGQKGYYGMFEGCTALETPPTRLAVTPTSTGHFQQMFKGCTSLVYSPALTATVVKQDGCRSMFEGCTSLLEAPEDLPATTLEANAYYGMFNGCSSLEMAPARIAAPAMSQSACFEMFINCSHLEEAPEILAVTLANSCFKSMFKGCVSLRKVQNAFSFSGIPDAACYEMFANCEVLNNAPSMSSVTGTIGTSGCENMFYNCAEMSSAPPVLTATTVGNKGYKQMFFNCVRLTTPPSISATTVQTEGCMAMFSSCTRLESAPDLSTVTTLGNSAYRQMFSGCTSLPVAPALPATTLDELAYSEMFYGCTALVTPPLSLPATTLPRAVYKQMFYNCTALTAIPDFPHDPAVVYVITPASTLDKGKENGVCFQMFFKCTSLENLNGRQLFNSISDLALGCFQDMFSTCSKLATVPPDFLPATTLAASCYRGMFQSTALIDAPELKATTLVADCYRWMFNNCKSLKSIKCYSTTPIGSSYTGAWLQNARNASDAVFHYRAGETWPINNPRNNNDGIPTLWTLEADTVE